MMLQDNGAFTIKDIAEVVSKTEGYISKRLNSLGIPPEGRVFRTHRGPASMVWKGSTINKLLEDSLLGNRKLNEVEWFDVKPTKVYIIRFNLNVDGKVIPSYKIGYTETKDVLKNRFKEEIKSGLFTEVELLAVKTLSSLAEAKKVEKTLFEEILNEFGGYTLKDGSSRFHNFYTKQQPKGITEMRKLNLQEIAKAKILLENA
jgi:RNase P/RNase MRP subunit POP5